MSVHQCHHGLKKDATRIQKNTKKIQKKNTKKRGIFETERLDQYEVDFLNPVKFVILCYINHKKATAKIGKLEKSGIFF